MYIRSKRTEEVLASKLTGVVFPFFAGRKEKVQNVVERTTIKEHSIRGSEVEGTTIKERTTEKKTT